MDYSFHADHHEEEFEFFEPFLKFYLIFYNANGDYRVDPQLLSEDICIKGQQNLTLVPSNQEEISTLCFTNKDRFLCLSTIQDQKLHRLLIMEFCHSELQFNVLHMVNYEAEAYARYPLSHFYYFQSSLYIGEKCILLCLQRNSPYKKLVYSFDGNDVVELRGVGNYLGKWKSGHFGYRDNLWILQEEEFVRVKFKLNNL